MTNTTTMENIHPTDDYMGGYGWFPIIVTMVSIWVMG